MVSTEEKLAEPVDGSELVASGRILGAVPGVFVVGAVVLEPVGEQRRPPVFVPREEGELEGFTIVTSVETDSYVFSSLL